MPGSYGKSVPLHQRSTRDIWIGIIWFVAIGAVLLYWTLPLLLPWHFSFAAVLLLGFLVLFESFILRGVWEAVAELRRRKRESK